MNANIYRNVLLVLTFAFGVVVAVLAVLDIDWLGTAAAVGGIVIGALWASTGFVGRARS